MPVRLMPLAARSWRGSASLMLILMQERWQWFPTGHHTNDSRIRSRGVPFPDRRCHSLAFSMIVSALISGWILGYRRGRGGSLTVALGPVLGVAVVLIAPAR